MACLLIGLCACSSPTKPSVSIAAGRPASPSSGTQISYYSQPVTLTVTSGVTTGNEQPVTTVEVATDPAFTMNVMTKNVSQGSSGQLTVILDHLNPSTTYYWRVKTSAADNPGAASAPSSFTVGPQLVIQPPVPVQPLSGSFPHKRPTFIVANAAHTGPVPTLTYRFEIATDAGFSNVAATATLPEGPNQTSFTPMVDLASGVTFYWRVQVTDTTTGVVSDYSTPQGFTTVNPDDGIYRYFLRLHFMSAAKCAIYQYGGSGPGYPVDPSYVGNLADIAFDAGLAVSGDHLRYVAPPIDSAPLELDVQRTGNQLSGTLGGDFLWVGASYPYGEVIRSAVASGTVDNMTGRLTGTARGAFLENGVQQYIECHDAVIAFTLTPHP